ncbi:metallophosphoesterase [Clostridium sp.]|uniref:metallophosphoesterase n=1 Tax=Clostridium sp. TaxID=1506 RepID=UPI002FC88A2C
MKNKKKILILLIVIISLGLFFYGENNFISINKINVVSNKLPENFMGYRIVHLSDLHNKSFRKNGVNLVKKVKKLNPDIIVFTGDIIDSRCYNEEISLTIMRQMVEVAPIYYVTGNHEWASQKFNALEKSLKEIGIKVIRNSNQTIVKDDEEVYILGIDDPLNQPINSSIKASMGKLSKDSFKILLSHRPEYISLYSKYRVDLVFSGHAHGGQIRLPFIGGLIAPGQGILPKYTSGKYTLDNTTMVVSRGLGNSIFPQRVFNRPEIIEVTLLRN